MARSISSSAKWAFLGLYGASFRRGARYGSGMLPQVSAIADRLSHWRPARFSASSSSSGTACKIPYFSTARRSFRGERAPQPVRAKQQRVAHMQRTGPDSRCAAAARTEAAENPVSLRMGGYGLLAHASAVDQAMRQRMVLGLRQESRPRVYVTGASRRMSQQAASSCTTQATQSCAGVSGSPRPRRLRTIATVGVDDRLAQEYGGIGQARFRLRAGTPR